MKCAAMWGMVAILTLAGSAAQGVSVYLTPSAQTIGLGGVAAVDVVIEGLVSPGMEALELTLAYDAAIIEAVDVQAGVLLTYLGEPLFEWTDYSEGGLIHATATLGPQSSTGSGVALTLTFEARSWGTSYLNWDIILVEPAEPYGSGGAIAHTESSGESITVVPEPSVLILMAAGLCGMLVRLCQYRQGA